MPWSYAILALAHRFYVTIWNLISYYCSCADNDHGTDDDHGAYDDHGTDDDRGTDDDHRADDDHETDDDHRTPKNDDHGTSNNDDHGTPNNDDHRTPYNDDHATPNNDDHGPHDDRCTNLILFCCALSHVFTWRWSLHCRNVDREWPEQMPLWMHEAWKLQRYWLEVSEWWYHWVCV